MSKFAVSLSLILFLSGCSLYGNSVPTVIPTGNPVTDVLVGALVQEGAQALAHAVVADGAPALGSMFGSYARDGCRLGPSVPLESDDCRIIYRDPGRLTVIQTRHGSIAHFLE